MPCCHILLMSLHWLLFSHLMLTQVTVYEGNQLKAPGKMADIKEYTHTIADMKDKKSYVMNVTSEFCHTNFVEWLIIRRMFT